MISRMSVSRTVRATVLAALTFAGLTAEQDAHAQSPAAPATQAGDTIPPPPPGVNASLDSARAVRGASLKISVYTYGTTDVVFNRFGHDALTIRDTLTGQDFAYNWGMFDFDQPNFYTRFLTGDTKYWLAVYPTDEFNQDYVQNNRSIRVQDLALTAVERGALLDFVIWNSSETNRYYRYDYYQDNCATRVRDAIDRVLRGRLKSALDTSVTTFTWRTETERSMATDIPLYAGIELALGRNADRKITKWESGFLPARLADALGDVVLTTDNGQRYRLVSRDSVVFQSSRQSVPIDPPERIAMAALLGLTLAGLIALMADSRFRALRVVLVVFAIVWYLSGGLLGTALLLAGTVTKHIPYMGANTTLWQINPVMLFAAMFVPVALKRREASNITRAIVVVCAMFAVFGVILQFVPMFKQHSGVVMAVTVPVQLALAIAVLRLPVIAGRRRPTGATAS